MALKPKLKAAWIKALRSGKFRQGRGSLYKDGKYCCLGVLARIQGCSTEALKDVADENQPPRGFKAGLRKPTFEKLVFMNDGEHRFGGFLPESRKSFKQIADWVQKNL